MPHITGADFRRAYGIEDGFPSAYALTYDDFASLAQGYGRMGGLDRIATVVKAIRADRPDAILLDGATPGMAPMAAITVKGRTWSMPWGC